MEQSRGVIATPEHAAARARRRDTEAPYHASDPWYPAARASSAVDVLDLLRRYRDAESAMRTRTRSSMRMNETDLQALRHVLRAQQGGELMRQRDLSTALGISSASVTALVDRLERSGHAERRAHPSDRRSVVVVATARADRELREHLDAVHLRMTAVVDGMSDEQVAAVGAFLAGMVDAVEGPSASAIRRTSTA